MSRYNLVLFLLVCSTVLSFCSYSFTQLQKISTVLAYTNTTLAVRSVPLERTSLALPASPPLPILFTGDVLLARHVEYLITSNGETYPFKNVQAVFASSSHVLINFEAAIPERHVKTPNGTLTFSVPAAYATLLANVGVTHVSLANNHATDYGGAGYDHTHAVMAANDITSFGHPTLLATSSITYIDYGDTRVGLIALHTLFVAPEKATLAALLAELASTSDIQIAYLHWGNEYELTHSLAQHALAETLIDYGIDAIVGHHPHVTQDIAVIRNVPIFYSLGNLVFDQYFSIAVQQGYLLSLAITPAELQFELLPVTSIGTRAQPRLMNQSEKNVFLDNLAHRSDPGIGENIKQGKVIIDRHLATSSKNSIISL